MAEKDTKAEAPAKRKEPTSDDLRDEIDKRVKALDKAKEDHIAAGDALERARVAFLDKRGEESEKSQVKV